MRVRIPLTQNVVVQMAEHQYTFLAYCLVYNKIKTQNKKTGVVKQSYFDEVPEVAGSNPAFALHALWRSLVAHRNRALFNNYLVFKKQ
ncbi:hypothetical protein DN068_01975 [Taibaiella soli]|uniref:Uncharacterized protein n=1 Tax=Taibaiella soli TaxID=1649169 RepID=A0A2W2AGI2_9BACT|nr:hypothetical protein DN068_01975 [Taibaiella soli]